MEVDALALKLRPRTSLEAADLGVRLCQHAFRSVMTCHLAVLLPVTALCMTACVLTATYRLLPLLALWWLKPWLDRPVLFALSHAAFGQRVRLIDLWRQQGAVLWRALPASLTLRRLSPWRSFTQPAHQLEEQRGRALTRRVRTLRGGRAPIAAAVTVLFSGVELCLASALVALIYWLAPRGYAASLTGVLSTGAPALLVGGYAAVLALCEPFYVAAGFGMYLNRRVELEAWDIEQEFRRAFA
jgi:signal transduction histidine kinase